MKRIFVVILVLVSSLLGGLVAANKASATGIDWQAGNIITDAVLTDKSTMSAAAIQSFLESKVPTCDTNGIQNSELGGPDLNGDGRVQRWEFGKAYYNQTTFPCLKDYRIEDGRLASQVIYDTAQKYSVNPRVLIVLLQKEQGLITDTWPLDIQYRSATGYGCPDTAACDSQYYGLLNQLDWAGKMFRAIIANSPTWYTPYILGNNFIAYNPNRDACGGSNVNIINRATQALYNYTPYQPNQATIDAGWGTAYCGAYGNLRFYQYFTEWFGSTRGGDLTSYSLVVASPITVSPTSPRAGDSVTVSFSVKNVSSAAVSYSANLAQCRIALYTNCDSAMGTGGTIAAGATKSFTYTITPPRAGQMTIRPLFSNTNGVWYRYGPSLSGDTSDITINVPQLRATGELRYSIKHPNVGESVLFSVPLINNGPEPITISTSLIQCRINGTTNCDTPPGGSDTIQPGQTKIYDYSIPITTSGTYTFVAYYQYENRWYKYIYLDNPVEVYATDITTNGTFSSSDAAPITNQPFDISYNLHNSSTQTVTLDTTITQCRFNSVLNCDSNFGVQTTLAQGDSITATNSFKSTSPGVYRFTPYYRIDGEYHIPRTAPTLSVPVSTYTADMRITDFSATPPSIGGTYDVTYTVKNYGSKTAYYSDGILQCRYNTVVNCDPSGYGQISITPGSSRTFTDRVSASVVSGTYRLLPYYNQDGIWHQYRNIDGTMFDQRTVTVAYIEPLLSVSAGIAISKASPQVGDTQTVQYTVTNNGTSTISVSKWVTQCRISGINCDAPNGFGPGFSLAPGASIALTSNHQVTRSGTYMLVPYFTYNGDWYRYSNNPTKSFVAN